MIALIFLHVLFGLFQKIVCPLDKFPRTSYDSIINIFVIENSKETF